MVPKAVWMFFVLLVMSVFIFQRDIRRLSNVLQYTEHLVQEHYDRHREGITVLDMKSNFHPFAPHSDFQRERPVISQNRSAPQETSDYLSQKNSVTGITNDDFIDIPIIYVITPTYYRSTQYPDLVRMCNTLKHIPRLKWIIIEDGNGTNEEIHELLQENNVSYVYFAVSNKTSRTLKGIDQRNAGIEWIRKHHKPGGPGVVYFADDDNTYSLQLFDEIRYTKKISVWATGLSGGREKEFPVVYNGKVVGFSAWLKRFRKFPLDMAGFALNVQVLFDYPNMRFLSKVERGLQESAFLQQCCKIEEVEPKGNNGTKVLAWHTKDVIKKYPMMISWRKLLDKERKETRRIKKDYLKRKRQLNMSRETV